jgi:CheY-like chemotaxis protein
VDPARLRQILLNLVGNAIKFTDIGRVDVSACLESGGPGMLNVTVRDTGCGIPPDIQEVIFDSFQQADNSSTREYGGAGLGLAICKRLSVLMQGEIQLESRVGEGSVFTVRLPVSEVGPERSPAMPREHVPAAIKKARSCRILLVEDDPVSMELACRVLGRGGHTLNCVTNGELALDACGKETFDLVLMDLKLPVMDGLEAARRLRQSGFSAPIIALTACAFDDDRQACMDVGMDAWMTKPVTPEALEQAIAGIAQREDDTRKL